MDSNVYDVSYSSISLSDFNGFFNANDIFDFDKHCLKISERYSKAEQSRTDNAMIRGKKTNRQTMRNKTLHRKQQTRFLNRNSTTNRG